MKKLLLLLMLTSCSVLNLPDNMNVMIVTDVTEAAEFCIYNATWTDEYGKTCTTKFYDEFNKFQIGDTIKVTKWSSPSLERTITKSF